MKLKEKKSLREFIINDLKDVKGVHFLHALFREYSRISFKENVDLRQAFYEFEKYVKKNKARIAEELLNKRGIVASVIMDYELEDLRNSVENFLNFDSRIEVQNFTGIVDEICAPSDKILDIGGGAIPFSSVDLAKKKHKVTAMDIMMIDDDYMKNKYGVDQVNRWFVKDDVIPQDVDIVVSRKACYAFMPIVNICSKMNKPFILKLCNCQLERMRTVEGNIPKSWKEMFDPINSHIQYYEGYAVDLLGDANEYQLKRLIARYESDGIDDTLTEEEAREMLFGIIPKRFQDNYERHVFRSDKPSDTEPGGDE